MLIVNGWLEFKRIQAGCSVMDFTARLCGKGYRDVGVEFSLVRITGTGGREGNVLNQKKYLYLQVPTINLQPFFTFLIVRKD